MRLINNFPLTTVLLVLLLSATALLLFLAGDFQVQWQSYTNVMYWKTPAPVVADSSWHGWSGVQRLFIFGDSESTTDFDIDGKQPTRSQPMGNPADVGRDYGASWPYYLTTSFNDSLVQTYNLAVYGSTVDGNLVDNDKAPDFTGAIAERFQPSYFMSGNNFVGWTSSNSLFAIWFGVNDVNRLVRHQQLTDDDFVFAMTKVQAQYLENVRSLYQLGARNFLLINMPPLDRGPIGHLAVPPSYLATAIELWNAGLVIVKANLEAQLPDATIFLFDNHAFFNTVIDEPKTYPETSELRRTSTCCSLYQGHRNENDAYENKCRVAYRQHLWYDELHFTFTMHRAIASRIAAFLSENVRRNGELKKVRELSGRRTAHG